jgi:hypothetical protein
MSHTQGDQSLVEIKNNPLICTNIHPLDMHEYPPGSGRFMSLQQMIEARNADARKNIQEHGWDYPSPNPHTEVGREIIRNYPPIPSRKQRMDRNNIMVNSETGVYDPNDPNSWHPM